MPLRDQILAVLADNSKTALQKRLLIRAIKANGALADLPALPISFVVGQLTIVIYDAGIRIKSGYTVFFIFVRVLRNGNVIFQDDFEWVDPPPLYRDDVNGTIVIPYDDGFNSGVRKFSEAPWKVIRDDLIAILKRMVR